MADSTRIDLGNLDYELERRYFREGVSPRVRACIWQLHSALVEDGIRREWSPTQSDTVRQSDAVRLSPPESEKVRQ